MISVILTKYKRTYLFNEQLKSIKNQSILVDDILICDNTVNNKGVWDRFRVAKDSVNDYVCIFDDDTIPGPKFLESCYNEMQKKEGLYGTRGLTFKSNKTYGTEINSNLFLANFIETGWQVPNNNTNQVDYVTHSWFFKKKWLSYYWRVKQIPLNFGEDMNFSYQLAKEGIDTFVPPHPIGNKDIWGSINGDEYGDDGNGLWTENEGTFRKDMFSYFDELVSKDWELINGSNLL